MARGVPRQETTPVVETTRAAEVPELLHIPQDVVDYFDGKGKRLCLASNHDRSIDQRALFGSYPVVEEDIDGDEDSARIKKILSRANFKLTSDGYYKRSDNFLFAMTHEAYEAFIREGERMFEQQISPDSYASKLDELQGELRAVGLTESTIKPSYSEFPV